MNNITNKNILWWEKSGREIFKIVDDDILDMYSGGTTLFTNANLEFKENNIIFSGKCVQAIKLSKHVKTTDNGWGTYYADKEEVDDFILNSRCFNRGYLKSKLTEYKPDFLERLFTNMKPPMYKWYIPLSDLYGYELGDIFYRELISKPFNIINY